MGIVIRQSIITTIISYLGVALGAINILWLFPKYLDTEEIGLLKVLVDVAFTILPFAHLGAASAATRFFSQYRTKVLQESFLTYLLVLPTIGLLIFTSLFLLFEPFLLDTYFSKSPLLQEYSIYILPITFFVVYSQVLESYIKTFYKTIIPNALQSILLRVIVSLLILLYLLEIIDFPQLVNGYAFSYGIQLIGLLIYLKKLMGKNFRINVKFHRTLNIKHLINYSGFVVMGNSTNTIISKIDTLMTASILGLSSTGIYTIAMYIAMVIDIPRKSISQISTPLLSKALFEKDEEKISYIYKKTSLHQFIIGSYVFLVIWLNIDSIFNLMPNSLVFVQGKYVVLFIGLSRLSTMTAGMTMEIVQNSSLYKWNLYFSPFSLLCIVITNLIFIPIWGITGAAATTFFNVLLINTFQLILINKRIKVHPFSKKHLYILVPICSALVINELIILFNTNEIISIAIKTITISIIYGFSIYSLNISEELKNTVIIFLKRLLRI